MEYVKLLVVDAIAQAGGQAAAGTPPPAPNIFVQLLPIAAIMIIFYFLLMRPQQKARKQHNDMVMAVRRGDRVVTAGGIVGKVTKAGEGAEITVELAEGVQVTVIKATLSDVKSKTEPAEKSDKSTGAKGEK